MNIRQDYNKRKEPPMEKFLKESDALKKEADALLEKTGIVKILSRFGTPSVTGSYSYDLLTWRDIDICLTVKKPDARTAVRIGMLLAILPGVATMYFRNELVLKTEGNPKALFWCIEFISGKNIWKIDILISDQAVVNRVLSPGKRLKKELTPEKRRDILRIKSVLSKHKQYRRQFRSTDIYNAVIQHGIRSLRAWRNWRIKSKQGT
jgi:hypothetical protein